MLDWLKTLYRTPSDQPGDPLGWLGNQSAHVLIIGGGLVLICWALGLPGPALVGALYFGWEFGQWRIGGWPWDCAVDWLFVTSGAVLVHAGLERDAMTFVAALVLILIAALVGVWRRL